MFNKNPEDKKAVVPFGGYGAGNYTQRMNAATARPKRGKGTYLNYGDQFKPGTHVPDLIRLLPGNFVQQFVDPDSQELYEMALPWYQYREHYHAVFKKSSHCSAGPYFGFKDKSDDCYGCDIFWWEVNERKAKKAKGDNSKGPNSISCRDMFVYSALVMGLFHKVPRTDAQGNTVTSRKTGKAFYDWEKCLGVGCQYCTMGLETKEGHVQPWPMGSQHFETLNAYVQHIQRGCTTCGGRATISTVLWQCPNPECGELIVDLQRTNISPEQLEQLTTHRMTCKSCRNLIFPQEVFECSNCTPQGLVPVRATIFDVDLTVQRQKNPDPNRRGTILIVPQWTDPCAIDAKFKDIAKPLKLDQMYAPTPLDEQAKKFQISQAPNAGTAPAPAQGATPPAAPGYQPYGQTPPAGQTQQ